MRRFVQNQIKDLPGYGAVITDALSQAGEARFAVAYVKENGVDMILEGVRGKPAKLLCSFDMGITQLSGISKLIENGVEVRVYKSGVGTFHPKVWLFKTDKGWRALVGSANLTEAALVHNVEAGVLLDDEDIVAAAVMFFNYLWDADNSHPVTLKGVAQLQEQLGGRKSIRKNIPPLAAPSTDDGKIRTLFSFIKDWIDISKWKQEGISSLWRGWYVIPDHGYVDDVLVNNLAAYMSAIGDGIDISRSLPSRRYRQFLDLFAEKSGFQRASLKLSPHDLFVRQAKNYLIKFGWAHHPLAEKNGKYKTEKSVLLPTALGRRVAACRNVGEIRSLYSGYFEEYTYNGLCIVKFTRRLLERFGRLHLREFDYFVTHAYNDDDMETVSEMIVLYRGCTDAGRRRLDDMVKEYFNRIKEPTAQNVHGNYVKNVKHTISAIAWCSGFNRSDDFTVGLDGDAD